MLNRIFKYDRKYIKAEKYIHIELRKLEINKNTKEIYCLLNSEIFKISFDKQEFFPQRGLAGVYIKDFSISENSNKMIVGGWQQSFNPPLKLYKIEKKYGKYLWVKTSFDEEYLKEDCFIRERVDRYGCALSYNGEEDYNYVKLSMDSDMIVTVSGSNIFIYDIDGVLRKEIFLNTSKVCIDVLDNIVAFSYSNILILYDLTLFKYIKKIELSKKIEKIKIINDTNLIFVILESGELVILKKYKIERCVKTVVKISVLKNDFINSIVYFGNYFGDFGAVDYNGNIIYEDNINDNIRDILIVNKGDNIIVACKNVEFYIYERQNKLNEPKDIIFKWHEKEKNMKKIFLSYCWENEKIADDIENLFNENGIKLTRDKRDLKYKDSIEEFMEKVRDADFVIMLITKEYLESVNCMYEVIEFIKDKDFEKRILPLVQQDAKIFKTVDRIQYIQFWKEQYNLINEKANEISREDSVEISNDIRKISNIKRTISEFMSIIAGMNNIVYDDKIEEKEIEKMIDEINKGYENTLKKSNEEKDTDFEKSYYIINVPRTLCERNKAENNTILWWAEDGGYTDDLKEAKIFTLQEANEIILDSYNWGCRKYAAIPAELVKGLGQTVVPMIYRFKNKLLKENDLIIGNNKLYLDADEIRELI